ncbi:MAG: hypothetical protein WAW54_03825 [Parvibaculum sedimenti]|uniref:hypothetical protein n=1 Tax=Parvibaculum sedimenti TaxID=2608632 RepID=UPI003BB497D5
MRFPGVLFLALVLYGHAAASPHTDYMLRCMGCHLPDGAETPGKVPPLKDHVAKFLAAKGGRAYLVQVPGTRQSALSNAAVADLLNWLVRNFDAVDVPANFTPYTEGEVAALRSHRLHDVAAERARLIKSLPKGN